MQATHSRGPAARAARAVAALLLVLPVLLAVLAGRGADAHGDITYPKARQVVANELGVGNVGGCPHCMQGGRAGAQPDICGAPGQGGQDVTSLYFGPQATLSAGQVVNFGLYINAQHGGRHWFSVCPLPRQQATQACFDKPEHQLVRADGSYGDGKRYYYMLGSGWGGKEGDYVLK
ncbi:hypothetical protein MNEG_14408 [Monoraphidium neglectum]|uniref:Uncharacterized protein n=1 Tax=Monoraphidium neglectum TaxID=145388 RepID=A0A0D2MEG5_9CHLO|nr:hypothetical protein MNEG_14408 [Monoraphidium neglectum]KIY93555.1 hypothetical protein MNEG_14408 [Monoraphidium neglectum]|eukprot:XP_013892575.1 hypothetical protein MNEG_14408 [Monoraphidium neglectum]